jgi:hypothetical protein
MQRKEPRRAPMTERRSSKIGMDSAIMNDIKQLKATQELFVSVVPKSRRGDLQPDNVVNRGVPGQVSGTTQDPDKD